jgi:hypothetical protein
MRQPGLEWHIFRKSSALLVALTGTSHGCPFSSTSAPMAPMAAASPPPVPLPQHLLHPKLPPASTSPKHSPELAQNKPFLLLHLKASNAPPSLSHRRSSRSHSPAQPPPETPSPKHQSGFPGQPPRHPHPYQDFKDKRERREQT